MLRLFFKKKQRNVADLSDRLECLWPRDIVDKKCTIRIFIVYSGDSAETILTCYVPKLQADGGIITFLHATKNIFLINWKNAT